MTLMEEKTLADHDINVRSIRQELRLLEEQLKKHEVTDIHTGYVGVDDDYPVSVKQVLNITAELGALETQSRVRELPRYQVTADPDTVSRQAVYDTLTEYYHHTTEIQHKALREALERVPPSPSRPHGQWIKAKDLSGEYYYCSNCKEELPRVATESATWDNPYPTEYSIDTTDFCPHCGANMRQDRGAV